ncbi:MAG: TRAP transporter small permease subunit [Betaproteobacteria bacterium]|nr:TRAP transporter small permease subunit [Betaproteobacteria bacterium]
MGFLQVFADRVDRFNDWLGRTVSWLMLPVVLVAFAVVFLRYVVGMGFPWLQEVYIWLHGIAFMAAAAWVLKEDGHVRVDLIYKRLGLRARAWIELFGVFFFLMPMTGLMLWWAWPAVQRSWRLMERSPTSDGLHYMYVLKAFVVVFCVTLILQGLAMAARAVLVLAGRSKSLGAGRAHG